MSGFQVAADDVFAARVQVAAAVDDARSAVARVGAGVAELLDGWLGPAAAAYAAGFERWRAGADMVLAALAADGEGLERAARGYATAEAASRSAVLAAAP